MVFNCWTNLCSIKSSPSVRCSNLNEFNVKFSLEFQIGTLELVLYVLHYLQLLFLIIGCIPGFINNYEQNQASMIISSINSRIKPNYPKIV